MLTIKKKGKWPEVLEADFILSSSSIDLRYYFAITSANTIFFPSIQLC